MMIADHKDNQDLLPPRPGDKPKGRPPIKGVPFVLYINGIPIEMSKSEALGVLAQISQILCYLDNQEQDMDKEKQNG